MSAHPGRLPTRDFEEIRLAEALERGRCPVCDARQESAYAALRGLAREGATDRSLRAEMDKCVGFCQPHSVGLSKMELLQTSSQLATAVLLDAVLRRRLTTLKKLSRADAGAQGRGLAELADPKCPVCARSAEASQAAVSRLLALSADAAWSTALGTVEICLADLYALWVAAAAGTQDVQMRWSGILAAQLARLEALQKSLADYAHNSTADRRHLITAEQHEAAAASIRLFGGAPDRDRTR
ncbi:MAG: hypothetical protein ABSA21_06875 [Candidatus Limnocylindrales bacterium]|jgi:hypothetical protein